MADWYYGFKDAIGDYMLARRRDDPRWTPPVGLQWTYDNLVWLQTAVLFGAAFGVVAVTGPIT